MHKIAVINQKGGAGKTTTTVCLAGALAEAGWRVLVIDLDGQATASGWLGVGKAEEGDADGAALLSVLMDGKSLAGLVRKSPSGVDVVPGGFGLAGFDQATAGTPGAELLLRRAIEKLPGNWDVVLFDCPRALDRISVNALVAADAALVPVELKFTSLRPLGRLFQLVDQVRDRLNPELAVCGVLGGFMDARKNHPADVLESLRKQFGDLVFTSVIRDSIRFAESDAHSKPITLYEPSGGPADDFRAFAAEFAERIGRPLRGGKAAVNG